MFWRRRKQGDFSAEVEAHIELEAERLKEQGLSDEEARAAARRAFGNVTRAQERFYESGRWVWFDQLRQDIRYGLRQLRRNPEFTAVAVVTLALGIGANTAIFQLLDAVRLRNLPVRNPSELTIVHLADLPGWRGSHETAYPSLNNPLWEYFRDHQHVFSQVMAWSPTALGL